MKAFNYEDATKYGNKDAKQQAHSYSTIMLYEVSDIIEDTIDNAPTVEERPKGKWVAFDLTFGRNFYYCTVCKETEDLPPTRWFKFCPNCGADMRGGADNDPN